MKYQSPPTVDTAIQTDIPEDLLLQVINNYNHLPNDTEERRSAIIAYIYYGAVYYEEHSSDSGFTRLLTPKIQTWKDAMLIEKCPLADLEIISDEQAFEILDIFFNSEPTNGTCQLLIYLATLPDAFVVNNYERTATLLQAYFERYLPYLEHTQTLPQNLASVQLLRSLLAYFSCLKGLTPAALTDLCRQNGSVLYSLFASDNVVHSYYDTFHHPREYRGRSWDYSLKHQMDVMSILEQKVYPNYVKPILEEQQFDNGYELRVIQVVLQHLQNISRMTVSGHLEYIQTPNHSSIFRKITMTPIFDSNGNLLVYSLQGDFNFYSTNMRLEIDARTGRILNIPGKGIRPPSERIQRAISEVIRIIITPSNIQHLEVEPNTPKRKQVRPR